MFFTYRGELLCHDDLGGRFWLKESDDYGRPMTTTLGANQKFCHRGNYGPEAPVLLTGDMNGEA